MAALTTEMKEIAKTLIRIEAKIVFQKGTTTVHDFQSRYAHGLDEEEIRNFTKPTQSQRA